MIFKNSVFLRSIKSFGTAGKYDYHLSLLSYDLWPDKREREFAYYKDLYIENQKNISGEFIKTIPARAPRNYYRNGYMNFLLGA